MEKSTWVIIPKHFSCDKTYEFCDQFEKKKKTQLPIFTFAEINLEFKLPRSK